ncbi:YeeE/YedE thiosulfate transporter family protein [Dyella acidiphila]|uniref:YeeE/YedE family protein n=1 Tax=Dyella acidiphila TaxID=2775866 RepID=A0ABR9GD63_9GAMM|nr:YeeE/YedE thiosulfate transporter family protein [Dyella acidiphila]MBE1161985.1 YeeE/YedE family protein [Dyella acidiphila]
MNDLLIAGGIGVAFGAALECAGLGDPPKLAGQFYLRDFTVLKVMLSAMLTAMLGAFWGGRLGLFDSAAFYVPDTYLLPQLVGGLIFGLGFVLSGLCPGTSCVALAGGRIEGAATMLGLLAGLLLVGLAFPAIESFYRATPYGPLTLQGLTGLPYGVVVALVTVIAISVLAWIAKREARP